MVTYKAYRIVLISLLCLVSASLWAADEARKIKIMTYNQYIGADLKPVLEAIDRSDFNGELVDALQGVAASRVKDRIQRQAAIIAREKPDVVALQEVWAFKCKDVDAPFPNQGCADPRIAGAFVDFLDELLAALNTQGVKYRAVSKVKNLDLAAIQVGNFAPGIPFDISGLDAVLSAIDRDVILVRNDLKAKAVNFSLACPNRTSVDGCTYDLLFTSPTPIGPITLLHGFSGVDLRVGRKNFRVINTHLEQRDPAPPIQADQADELIRTLNRSTPRNRSLLVLGDMNSSPTDDNLFGINLTSTDTPYQQFLDAGYTDVWRLRRPVTFGYTCCQAENVQNSGSQLNSRIDFIFSRQAVKRGKLRLVGTRQADKTTNSPKLWPSDHAGIVAELHY